MKQGRIPEPWGSGEWIFSPNKQCTARNKVTLESALNHLLPSAERVLLFYTGTKNMGTLSLLLEYPAFGKACIGEHVSLHPQSLQGPRVSLTWAFMGTPVFSVIPLLVSFLWSYFTNVSYKYKVREKVFLWAMLFNPFLTAARFQPCFFPVFPCSTNWPSNFVLCPHTITKLSRVAILEYLVCGEEGGWQSLTHR